MKPILEVRNISKKFSINKVQSPYLSLRESFQNFFVKHNKGEVDFYALKDISFDVMPGETVGIIGKNGAGKSTLLKILSKITPPTSGSVICRGRVASLLEVGTGFHPELTGRENIFFNGSILGMRRKEIKDNFDEIVEFSGVGKFIDTPLKHYSSGMQLRLAFAVAAFLQNEILIIDEILAVGDSEFQRKCLGKMDEVSKSGRTVLFVSHDLNALSVLTKKSVLLNNGMIEKIDTTHKVISHYFFQRQQHLNYQNNNAPEQFPIISSANLITSHPNNVQAVREKLVIEITLDFPVRSMTNTTWLSVHITDMRGKGVVHLWVNSNDIILNSDSGNKLLVTCEIPSVKLYMGNYFMNLYLSGPPGSEVYDKAQNICPFEIIMLNIQRDFPFEPDVCTYLEDAVWQSKII